MRKLPALLFVVACGGSSSRPSKLDGTASIGGKPAKLAGCKRVEDAGGFATVEIALDTGLVFTANGTDGNRVRTHDGKETTVECGRTELDSEGGGLRLKGTLAYTCETDDGELTIDATFDCRK